MSLILEALKKSEQQRRLGEAPRLGTPVLVMRRRGRWLPVIAALVVVAVALGGWFWWRAPPGAAKQVVSGNTTQAGRPTDPAATVASRPGAVAAARGRARERKPAAGRPLPGAALKPASPQQAAKTGQAGATAASGTLVLDKTIASGPAGLRKAGARAPVPKTTRSASGKSTPPTSGFLPATPLTGATRAPAQTKSVAPNPVTTAPTPPAAPKPVANGPKLPMVWELPLATRTELPDLSMIMHVYSADPAQRFIVLNGDRHVEGDAVSDDLKVVEIRPDGVVLEYKGASFVLPRNGR